MLRNDSPTGQTFISYAYGDDGAARALEQIELPAAILEFFEPIEVPPYQMVSEKLVSAIQACDSLIYIDTPKSRHSPWVTLETDYARRNSKPVFRFQADDGLLQRDNKAPLDLPVFSTYARKDRDRVIEIARFMKKERSFDIFIDLDDLSAGELWEDSLQRAISERLERGGYAVAFWSRITTDSQYAKQEIKRALMSHPDQVIVALLEDMQLPDALTECQAIHLNLAGSTELDRRRVDDLIVRIYWLMQEHSQRKA